MLKLRPEFVFGRLAIFLSFGRNSVERQVHGATDSRTEGQSSSLEAKEPWGFQR